MTEFDYDCMEKLLLARCARHRVGRRKAVRLPSDCLDQAGWNQRNGPCQIYRLGQPMRATQLLAMPEDLQRAYLLGLRRRGGSRSAVGRMLGISPAALDGILERLQVRLDQPDEGAWAAFLGL